jgi:hypothetical protein
MPQLRNKPERAVGLPAKQLQQLVQCEADKSRCNVAQNYCADCPSKRQWLALRGLMFSLLFRQQLRAALGCVPHNRPPSDARILRSICNPHPVRTQAKGLPFRDQISSSRAAVHQHCALRDAANPSIGYGTSTFGRYLWVLQRVTLLRVAYFARDLRVSGRVEALQINPLTYCPCSRSQRKVISAILIQQRGGSNAE